MSIFFVLSLVLLTSIEEAQSQERHILRIGTLRELESLNPLVGWSTLAYEIYNLNYNLLITWDEHLEVAPALAKRWEVSPDGKEWTFYLRDDVTWQDGEPFTAADVKFTLDSIKENQYGYFYDYVTDMKEVKTPDDYTVIIELEEIVAWMPQLYVYILPKHIWEDIDPVEAEFSFANTNPIGTGPFQVTEHRKGEYVKLVANESYFKGSPQIDEIFFMTYGNASTMVEALKLGEIDAVKDIPAPQFEGLEGYEEIATINAPSANFTSISFNCWEDPASQGNPLLLDPAIRRAMEHAIDREYLINVTGFGYATPGSTVIPPVLQHWHLELEEEEFRAFDLEKANQILDEAGYNERNRDGIRQSKEGDPLEFRLFLRSEAPDTIRAARVFTEWFKEIGINTITEVMDGGTLTDRIYDNANFDLFIWGWYVEFDPSLMLSVLTSDQIMWWSDTFFANPEYDALYREQERLLDQEERQEVVHKMQRLVYEEAPYIVLWYGPDLQAYRTDRFKGFTEVPQGGLVINTYTVATYENLQPK